MVNIKMVNGLRLYSAFIQSASQCMPHIHPFTHTFTHTFTQRWQRNHAGRQPAQREQVELGVLLKDTTTDMAQSGNPGGELRCVSDIPDAEV